MPSCDGSNCGACACDCSSNCNCSTSNKDYEKKIAKLEDKIADLEAELREQRGINVDLLKKLLDEGK